MHNTILFGLKNKEILLLATTWMNPESIMLSDASQRKTNTNISLICGISKNKNKKPQRYREHPGDCQR